MKITSKQKIVIIERISSQKAPALQLIVAENMMESRIQKISLESEDQPRLPEMSWQHPQLGIHLMEPLLRPMICAGGPLPWCNVIINKNSKFAKHFNKVHVIRWELVTHSVLQQKFHSNIFIGKSKKQEKSNKPSTSVSYRRRILWGSAPEHLLNTRCREVCEFQCTVALVLRVTNALKIKNLSSVDLTSARRQDPRRFILVLTGESSRNP